MFYSTGRHRFNSGWLVCGTRWAPCVDNNSSIYRGITFTHCRAALPLLLVTSQVSGCLQPSCRSSQNTKKWCRTAPHPPRGELLCLLDLQTFTSLYVPQQLHNTPKYQVFHLPAQDSVTAQNPTRVIQWEICHWEAGTVLLLLAC